MDAAAARRSEHSSFFLCRFTLRLLGCIISCGALENSCEDVIDVDCSCFNSFGDKTSGRKDVSGSMLTDNEVKSLMCYDDQRQTYPCRNFLTQFQFYSCFACRR
ncbi:hypothetical protein Fmac_008637 [Flemingia macrophylla]|uniref:Uncharacterized protein n=1 Tax=Flemingia macrophylla TaxID=520843 RepID=A0ABD1MYV2_9FABA